MIWLGAAFLALVAMAMVLQRRPLAEMQAQIFGGNTPPGCVIAEAVALLVLAAVIVWVERGS